MWLLVSQLNFANNLVLKFHFGLLGPLLFVELESKRLMLDSFCCQFQDIRAVLHRNPKGQKVLAEYDRHRTLSSESRQTLVKIVVAQLVHDYGM